MTLGRCGSLEGVRDLLCSLAGGKHVIITPDVEEIRRGGTSRGRLSELVGAAATTLELVSELLSHN